MKKSLLLCALSFIYFSSMAQNIPQGFTKTSSNIIYKVEKINPTGQQVEENSLIFGAFSIAFNDSIVMNGLNRKSLKEPVFLVSKQNNMFKGDLMDGLLLMRSGEEYTFAFPKDSMAKIQRFPEGFEGWVYYRVRVDSVCSYDIFMKEKQMQADSLKKIEQERISSYLEENNWENKDIEGIYYKELVKGVGEKAKNGDKVKVNYTGQLLDGKVFDSSLEDVAKENGLYNPARKYEPIEFTLGAGQMIRGFEIAARQMSKGTRAMVLIPSSLAYGNRDMGTISPYSPLVFTMELVEIEGDITIKEEEPTIKVQPTNKKTNNKTTNKNNNKKTNKK